MIYGRNPLELPFEEANKEIKRRHMEDSHCDLCRPSKRMERYVECPEFLIVDCEWCDIPMIIDAFHESEFNEEHWELAKHTAIELFGAQIRFRRKTRHEDDHAHVHVRNARIP